MPQTISKNQTKMLLKCRLSFIATLVIFITSCESHEKKVDDAFERVKQSKMNGTDSITTNTNLPVKEPEIKVIVKNELVDEWQLFKNETDLKLNGSDAQIKVLRGKNIKFENKNKFEKQTKELEQKNNDLRKRMNDYNEERKLVWEKFKLEINHDIDEIGIELKDITINNTKVKK